MTFFFCFYIFSWTHLCFFVTLSIMKPIMITIQGQKGSPDINLIRKLIADNPTWGRSKLSKELCHIWNWYGPNRQLKDMACRTMLLKLEQRGSITLPPRKTPPVNHFRNRRVINISHSTEPVNCSLAELLPLKINTVSYGTKDQLLFRCFVSKYHYLGLQNTVGENMQYLVRDCHGSPLACLLFGSAAWKVAPRDNFIGWDVQTRQTRLCFITNNTRFLILPWVNVPHLASHILAKVARTICLDWKKKYGHCVYMLETFVDRSRYRGTCYRAANWIFVGTTKGRSRNDRENRIRVPVKDIYLYPLAKKFHNLLLQSSQNMIPQERLLKE